MIISLPGNYQSKHYYDPDKDHYPFIWGEIVIPPDRIGDVFDLGGAALPHLPYFLQNVGGIWTFPGSVGSTGQVRGMVPSI